MGAGPTGHDERNLFLHRWLQIRRTRWRRCILRTIGYQEAVQAPGPLYRLSGGGPRYKEALTCLGNFSLQRGHLNIYRGSQAAIKSIYSTNTNSRTIADCRRSLHEMVNQFTISLIWTRNPPGHRRQLHSGRVSQGGHHQASPPRRGECRYAHGNLQAKYKKVL